MDPILILLTPVMALGAFTIWCCIDRSEPEPVADDLPEWEWDGDYPGEAV